MKTKLLRKKASILLMLVSLSFALNAQNLLTEDPNLEAGTGNSFDYRWFTNASTNITRETASPAPQSGASYAKIVTTTATPGQYFNLGMSNFQTLNSVLVAGNTYRLSFYYQNSAGHTFRAVLQDNTGRPPYDFFQTISTTATDWTLYTYEFTVTSTLLTGNDVRVQFQFSNDLGTTLIDNVQLTAVTPPAPSANLVLNPSFEFGAVNAFTNWTAYGNPAVTSATTAPQEGTRYMRADVTTGSAGNAYDVQFLSDDFAVTAGKNYLVSFWYKSDKTIRVVLQNGSYYYSPTDIPASATPGTWVKYEHTWNFPSDRTETAMSLRFHLNVGNGFVQIDNTSVTDLSSLPVTLNSYTAKSTLSSVILNWSTSSEINNSHFQILRANDDNIFKPLFTETAKNKPASYIFVDNEPMRGNNYYKLIQFDNDGKATELGVKAIKFSLNENDLFSVYPNPTSNFFKFDLKDYFGKSILVQLNDLSGRVVFKETVENNSNGNYTIQIPKNLNSSIYSVIITGDGLNKRGSIAINN